MLDNTPRNTASEKPLEGAVIRAPLEQYFLHSLEAYRNFLSGIDLRDRQVLELGAGTGALTGLVLERDPAKLLAFEIAPGLCEIDDPRLDLREEDFTTADLGMLDHGSWCLISNPPYSCLDSIRQLIDEKGIQDVVLMVPAKKVVRFPGYTTAFTLDGSDFHPPSEGQHHIIYKGFGQDPASAASQDRKI